MGIPSQAIDEVPATRTPLRIVVSEARQTAALKALVAQCVPMLQSPERFTIERRRELAQCLARAICHGRDTQEPESLDPDGEVASKDDPGTWLEGEE